MTSTAAALVAALLELSSAAAPLAHAPPDPAPPALAAAPAGPVLTLAAALRRAAGANLDLQAARARLDQARAAVAKAWSAQLPQLTATASFARNSEAAALDVPTGFLVRDLGTPQGPPAGQGVPGAATPFAVVPSGAMRLVLRREEQLATSVEVRQPVFAPAVWSAAGGASLVADAAERSVEATRREVLAGVAQAYHGVVSLRRAREISERLLEVARRQERDARARLEAGAVPRVAVVRAEIDRARAEQDLLRAHNAHDEARVGLALLLDRDDAFEVEEEPPEPPLGDDTSGLEAAALRDRPDVQATRLAAAAALRGRRAAALRYAPTVAAFGRWEVSNVEGLTGRRDAWTAGVGVSLTVLDGGLREAELREAGARVREAEARRRAAEARAVAEVRQGRLALASARANARKAREQAELAAENQRLVEAAFAVGAATAVEQADATATYRASALAATAEDLQARVAAIRLLQAAGRFDPDAAR